MPDLEPDKPATPLGQPFPWFCPRCRRKEVRPATIPYRGVRTFQGRDYVVEVPVRRRPAMRQLQGSDLQLHRRGADRQGLEDLVGKMRC